MSKEPRRFMPRAPACSASRGLSLSSYSNARRLSVKVSLPGASGEPERWTGMTVTQDKRGG